MRLRADQGDERRHESTWNCGLLYNNSLDSGRGSIPVFHSGKQVRFHLRLMRFHAVGQMKDFFFSALADRFFEEAKQWRLRGVALESGNLGFNFPRLKVEHRGGGRQ